MSGFWNGNYYRYDCRTTPCTETGPIKEGGIYGSFDTLPADTYMIKLTTTDGQTATTDIPFAGPLALPVVASSSMQSQWSDGDLVLNWTNPTGQANWSEVEQIRLGLYDLEYNDVLYVYLDATAETITLPAALIQKASKVGSSNINYWGVQTRAYDEDGMNYTRGNSEMMPLSYSLGWSYLQYRTHENSIDNGYRFWLEVREDGGVATTADFTNFRIADSSGNFISTETPNFWTSPFPCLIYDCRTMPCSGRRTNL
jgi:hypothetical protein